MEKTPYSDINSEDLILRDRLAADRTVLANERTFLAYVRTALTLFVAGASFIKFFDSQIMEIIGWLFIPLGIWVFLIGIDRYAKFEESLIHLYHNKKDLNTDKSRGHSFKIAFSRLFKL